MPIKTANDMTTKLQDMSKKTNLPQFIKEEYEGVSNSVSKSINKQYFERLTNAAQLDTIIALRDNDNVIRLMEKIFSKIQSKDAFKKFNHIVDELVKTKDPVFDIYENCLAALMGSVNDKMEIPFMGDDNLDAICKRVHDTGSINTKDTSKQETVSKQGKPIKGDDMDKNTSKQETAPSIASTESEISFDLKDNDLIGADGNDTQTTPSIDTSLNANNLFSNMPSDIELAGAILATDTTDPIHDDQSITITAKPGSDQESPTETLTPSDDEEIDKLIKDTLNKANLDVQISDDGKLYLKTIQNDKNIVPKIKTVALYELLSGIRFNDDHGIKNVNNLNRIPSGIANQFKDQFNSKDLLKALCGKLEKTKNIVTYDTLNNILSGTQGTQGNSDQKIPLSVYKRTGMVPGTDAQPLPQTPAERQQQKLIDAGITDIDTITNIVNNNNDKIDDYIDTWNNSDGNTLSNEAKPEAFKKCLEVVVKGNTKYTNVLMSNDTDLSPLIKNDTEHPYHTYTFSEDTIKDYNAIKNNFNKALESIKQPNSSKCIISDPTVTADKLRDVVAQATSGKCTPNTNFNLIYDTYMVNNEFNKNNPIVAAKIHAAMDSKQDDADKINSGKKARDTWNTVLANAMELTKVNSVNELNDDIKNFINNRTVAPTKKELDEFIKQHNIPISAPTGLNSPDGFNAAITQAHENRGEFTHTGSSAEKPSIPAVQPQPVPAAEDDETDFAPLGRPETANPFGIIDDDFLPPSLEPDFEDDDEEQEMDPRTAYPKVYELIRKYSFNNEQAETASMMADDIIEHRGENPYEFSKLSHIGKDSMDVIYNLIDKANPRLGHREAYSKPATNATSFMNPISTRSVTGATVKSGLAMPPGFKVGFDKSIWDKPVITEFGYPFVNYSNEAIYNLLHAKDEKAQKREYKNLKKMLKEAKLGSKHIHGAIWDAIYTSPLKLLKEFAADKGLKCKPNMLKVDGNTLFSLNQGESILVTPIKYYSAKAEYEKPIKVTSSFLTNFYTVLDYSNKKADIESYLKYANGMTQAEFNEEIDRNNGIPPFYILYVEPSNANVFKKSEIATTSGFGSLLHTLFRTRDTNVMVKTRFKGYSGGFVIPKSDAERLFSTIE